MTADEPDRDARGASGEDWERGGARVGHALDGANLVFVVGRDVDATAHAALGVARAQATRRRVAVGDLLGDAPPIQHLLTEDDPHGLVDSFLYGVSLNRIARHVPGAGELYILPSGSDVPDYAEILAHSRWRRISAGFRETGALLVVAIAEGAEGLERAARLGDGVILLADGSESPDETLTLLATIHPIAPDRSPVFLTPTEESAAIGTPRDLTVGVLDGERTRAGARARSTGERRVADRPPIGRAAAIGGLCLAIAIVLMGAWLATRPLSRGHAPATTRGVRGGDAPASVAVLDSPGGNGGARPPAFQIANAADSSNAAAYAVALNFWNTQSGPIAWFQTAGRDLPAPTFTPVMVKDVQWFRVFVGAYRDRATADSLLGELRARGAVANAEVVRLPLAFLVDTALSPTGAREMLGYFAGRGQPVYALRADDGTVRLYAGAFANDAQAALFMKSIGVTGFRPVLAYRLGRVF